MKVGRKPKDKADLAPRKRAKRKRVTEKEDVDEDDDEEELETDSHVMPGSESVHTIRSGLRMRTRTTSL